MSIITEVNRRNLRKENPSVFTRHMLNFECRVLYRRIRHCDKISKPSRDSVDFWNQVSSLHENYRRWAWKKRGIELNLDSPNTLAQKIEWLKLNYHRENLVELSDKLKVRGYVLEKTGRKEILNSILGIYSNTNDIPFANLPQNYVIRTNHWSGDTMICRDGTTVNSLQRQNIDSRIQAKMARRKVEWPYWHIQPKILVEEYLQDQYGQLTDYKIFCLNGEPRFIKVDRDRRIRRKRHYFDPDWKCLPIASCKSPKIEIDRNFPRPDSLDEMLAHASKLSEDLPFARIDFYDIDGECRFGEVTLYPSSGIDAHFVPAEWNAIFGGWLSLPCPVKNPRFAYGVNLY